MSIHRSLVLRGRLKRHRNVLKRSERIERLIEEEKFTDNTSVFGLPKLRNILQKVKPKPKKEAEAATVAPDVAAGTPAPGTTTAAYSPAPPGKLAETKPTPPKRDEKTKTDTKSPKK
jgi:small basic protein (TIGR04137 family)